LYRALFNVPAANELAQGRLAGLDANNAHAVSMGNLEVEGGSVNGRAATGTAFTVEAIRIREERKKQDAALIATIQQLSETLKRMDERIQKWNDEIKQLTKLRDAEEARSKAAFDKMHDLEIHLEDIEDNGLTDAKREALKRAIGQEAEGIDDDAELLKCARRCITEEQRNGLEAHTEAQKIDGDILRKITARDELIKTREHIASHPSASLEQKTALVEAALQRSLDQEQMVVEGIGSDINRTVDETRDIHEGEINSDEDFAFDEDISIQPASTNAPRP